jgi:hypothetical protein
METDAKAGVNLEHPSQVDIKKSISPGSITVTNKKFMMVSLLTAPLALQSKTKPDMNRSNSPSSAVQHHLKRSKSESEQVFSSNKSNIENSQNKNKKKQVENKPRRISKIKSQSTINNHCFIPNMLFVPGIPKSQRDGDSNGKTRTSIKTDLISSLGISNDIGNNSKKLNSMTVFGAVLKRQEKHKTQSRVQVTSPTLRKKQNQAKIDISNIIL